VTRATSTSPGGIQARDALEEKKRAVLREALDEGIAELEAGVGVESSPEELMAQVRAEAGLTR
jgi:hypothetical protein